MFCVVEYEGVQYKQSNLSADNVRKSIFGLQRENSSFKILCNRRKCKNGVSIILYVENKEVFIKVLYLFIISVQSCIMILEKHNCLSYIGRSIMFIFWDQKNCIRLTLGNGVEFFKYARLTQELLFNLKCLMISVFEECWYCF